MLFFLLYHFKNINLCCTKGLADSPQQCWWLKHSDKKHKHEYSIRKRERICWRRMECNMKKYENAILVELSTQFHVQSVKKPEFKCADTLNSRAILYIWPALSQTPPSRNREAEIRHCTDHLAASEVLHVTLGSVHRIWIESIFIRFVHWNSSVALIKSISLHTAGQINNRVSKETGPLSLGNCG